MFDNVLFGALEILIGPFVVDPPGPLVASSGITLMAPPPGWLRSGLLISAQLID